MGNRGSKGTRSRSINMQTLKPVQHNACAVCHEEYQSTEKWCRRCNGERFAAEFETWTSGNKAVDDFIRGAQRDATDYSKVIEWIPFSNFDSVEKIGRGGYGAVYHTKWKEGFITGWNSDKRCWDRRGEIDVALKSLDGSRYLAADFFDELKDVHQLVKYKGGSKPGDSSADLSDDARRYILPFYGITQDPVTQNYVFVMEYAQDGNLRNFLRFNYDSFPWRYRLSMLWTLAEGLRTIHQAGLIHGDFHCGNVLQSGLYSRIADLGLCQQFGSRRMSLKTGAFGVMSYIDPDVLRGKDYTKASDIYSFGMIMWTISSGQPPFYDIPHDINLAIQICDGYRPPVIPGTPPCYIDLMTACWETDPTQRPTCEDLLVRMGAWDIQEIRAAEEFRRKTLNFQKNPEHLSTKQHPLAIFFSRTLPSLASYADDEISRKSRDMSFVASNGLYNEEYAAELERAYTELLQAMKTKT